MEPGLTDEEYRATLGDQEPAGEGARIVLGLLMLVVAMRILL